MFQKVGFLKSVYDLEELPPPKYPEIALLGRSNAGKSSLINTLFQQRRLARVSSTPGFTQALNFYLVDGGLYLVDLPGYGFAKVPRERQIKWQALVEGYLKSPRDFRLFLLIFDIRRTPDKLDKALITFVKSLKVPFALILNKTDTLTRNEAENQRKVYEAELKLPPSIPMLPFSCKDGNGKDRLIKLLKELDIFSPV
ncbi:MAG: ribosome biogenesis GTP-binding protein YihA/YsxC [Caldimicrobium sp.]|nr:ribosome biogenesis GTP-binding protein YihA/YsxC [Caldimicrobium sp.]